MSEIDKILKKYFWPKNEIVKNLDFKEIENQIGFELPNDYKEFLLNYSFYETQIGEESFKLWDFSKLLEYNMGYEIIANLKMTIGIGDNGGGEFIGLEKLVDGKIRIMLTPYIDLDKEHHIEIGNSFTDFLMRMDNGEKWFKEEQTE
ncbi:SMI1/KNR4 family protein [Flavobacterium marginilacus]|uniref:SMI1/KNR4 family protein n=1 Tax=Flavobacterium marginilacus TaxID=3003256 RepID=UPI00248EFD10|nr:SMI1/KNR4 family protein [Flavobacterium marginilacus]